MKRALNIEITVESADAAERSKPLDILFQRRVDGPDVKKDPDGKINFAQWRSTNGTVVTNNKFFHQGRGDRDEFFVVVLRASHGAIGIIDPGIDNEPTSPN